MIFGALCLLAILASRDGLAILLVSWSSAPVGRTVKKANDLATLGRWNGEVRREWLGGDFLALTPSRHGFGVVNPAEPTAFENGKKQRPMHALREKSANTSNLQKAIKGARCGDTVVISKGVHRTGRIVVEGKACAASEPLVIRGEDRDSTILDGSVAVDLGKGYRESPLVWKRQRQNEWVADLGHLEIEDINQRWPTMRGRGHRWLLPIYDSPTSIRQGALRRGSGIHFDITRRQAIFVTSPARGVFDPSKDTIEISNNESLFDVVNSSHVEISNLSIETPGKFGIRAQFTEGQAGLLISDVNFSNVFRAISVSGGQGIRIRGCVIRNEMRSHQQEGERPWDWDAYQNESSYLDARGIDIRGVRGAEIHGNTVDGMWDGVKIDNSRDVRLFSNAIRNCIDDAVELESTGNSNIEVFSNRIERVFSGISFVSNKGGPIFVYRNWISSNLAVPMKRSRQGDFVGTYGYCLKFGRAWVPAADNIKIYHNSFFSRRHVVWDAGTTIWRGVEFVNNIMDSDGSALSFEDRSENDPAYGAVQEQAFWRWTIPPSESIRITVRYASEDLPYGRQKTNIFLQEKGLSHWNGGNVRRACGATPLRGSKGNASYSCVIHSGNRRHAALYVQHVFNFNRAVAAASGRGPRLKDLVVETTSQSGSKRTFQVNGDTPQQPWDFLTSPGVGYKDGYWFASGADGSETRWIRNFYRRRSENERYNDTLLFGDPKYRNVRTNSPDLGVEHSSGAVDNGSLHAKEQGWPDVIATEFPDIGAAEYDGTNTIPLAIPGPDVGSR